MPDFLAKSRGSIEATPLRRVSKALVVVIALASLSLAFRAARWVADRPLSEDAFYCYSVSYHLAHGEGPTIDGSTLTNGFHPLFVFLCTPLFAVAGQDKVLAVRLVFLLEWVLYVGTALLLGLVARDFGKPAEPRRSSAGMGRRRPLSFGGAVISPAFQWLGNRMPALPLRRRLALLPGKLP